MKITMSQMDYYQKHGTLEGCPVDLDDEPSLLQRWLDWESGSRSPMVLATLKADTRAMLEAASERK
jgi:hypothetical protein